MNKRYHQANNKEFFNSMPNVVFLKANVSNRQNRWAERQYYVTGVPTFTLLKRNVYQPVYQMTGNNVEKLEHIVKKYAFGF